MDHEKFMREAIAVTEEGIDNGQTPFGACIVCNGKVVARGHNRVWESTDITAHAEIVTIREACKMLGTIDLSDCVIYSTTEPCPMCFGAIHWAKLKMVVYGTLIRDAAEFGFNELRVTNPQLKREGGSPVELVEGILREECLELFHRWKARSGDKTY